MKATFFVFLFVLVDILGFSLVLPLLPYLSQEYGLSPSQTGLLQSANGMAQLVAVPIIGSLSDQHGRKPLLLISVFATFVSFLILARATSAFWVFFSRILDGLVGGNISLAQAYIADITSQEERAASMGLIGAAFGIGFIVGPALGGFLVKFSFQYPSYAAALLSFINFIGLLYLPESLPPEKRQSTSNNNNRSLLFIARKLIDCLSQRRVALILWLKFLYLVIFTTFESGFGYFNIMQLSLTPSSSSYLLCFYGLMFSAVQGGGIKALKKRFEEEKLFMNSLKVLIICYAIYSLTYSLWNQMLTLAALGIASGIMQTLITTRISKEVEPTLMGGALGVSAALGSFARIVAPFVTGVLIEWANVGSPFVFCSFLCIYLVTIEKQIQSVKAEGLKDINKSEN